MRIRIRRDDSSDEHPSDEPDAGGIVVARPAGAKEASDLTDEAEKGGWPESAPSQTTWAMVACQCTLTGRSYQLAFRKEHDTLVLVSIDPTVTPGTSKDMGGVEGPFDWAIFECPECGRTWRKAGDTEPPFPVVFCSCRIEWGQRRQWPDRSGWSAPSPSPNRTCDFHRIRLSIR